MGYKKINVVYVEDDEADVDFVQTALQETSCDGFDIRVIEDGEEALRYFQRDEKYQEVQVPNLVLLDLNLPKVNGKEVLRCLKASEKFKQVPVVILSTSASQGDVQESYALGAGGFITKPTDFDGYKETVKRIYEYWMKTCTVPEGK